MRCLIIDEMHDSIVPLLANIGLQADYFPNIKRPEILEIIAQYEGLVVRSKTNLDQEFFEKATHLQWIARAGAGLDQIDEKIAYQKNIAIFNAPEANRDAVGEHALGLLLSLLNKLHTADQEVRQKLWRREANRGYEIMGKTIGLIGFGHNGKAFAKKLSGFDCKVLAYDKYLENYSNQYGQQASMEEIFEQADVLSLHIPLTYETKNLVNLDFLNRFKKNIFLINCARGEIVRFETVVKGLESGKILAAGLDVLENEKLQTLSGEQLKNFEILAQSSKVIFSPHVAGWTFESYHKINLVLTQKIDAWLKNR